MKIISKPSCLRRKYSIPPAMRQNSNEPARKHRREFWTISRKRLQPGAIKPAWYSTRRGNDVYIGTKDKIYAYVDLGTSPHVIKPRRPGGRLRFFGSGFKPKSRVGYIASYGGRMSR